MKAIKFFLLFLIFSGVVHAQNGVVFKKSDSGKVDIIQNAKMTTLLGKYKNLSLERAVVEGYRVQIYFESGTNSKNLAEREKQRFERAYPDVPAYLSFSQPNFRVRVGNFKTYIEASAYQDSIKDKYPNSFTVKEEIPIE